MPAKNPGQGSSAAMEQYATGREFGTFTGTGDGDGGSLWSTAVPIEPMTDSQRAKAEDAMKAKVIEAVKAQTGAEDVVIKDAEEALEISAEEKALASRDARRADDKYISWLNLNKSSVVEENIRVDKEDEKLHEIVNTRTMVQVCPMNSGTHPPSLVPGIRFIHTTGCKKSDWTKFEKLMALPKVAKTTVGKSDFLSVPLGEWRMLGINMERCTNPEIYGPKIQRILKTWQAIRIKQIAEVDTAHREKRMGENTGIYLNLQVLRFKKYTKACAEHAELLKRQWHIDNKIMTAEEYDEKHALVVTTHAKKAARMAMRNSRYDAMLAAKREADAADNAYKLEVAEAEDGTSVPLPEHTAVPETAPGDFSMLPDGYGNPYGMGTCTECGGSSIGFIYRDGICKACWKRIDADAARETGGEPEVLTDDEVELDLGIIDLDEEDMIPEEQSDANDFPKKLRTSQKWVVVSYLLDFTTAKHNLDCPEAAGKELIYRIYGVFSEEKDGIEFISRLEKKVTAFEICLEAMYEPIYPEMTNWMEVETTFRNKHLQGMYDERQENQKLAGEYEDMYAATGEEAPVIDVSNPEKSAVQPELDVRIE